MAGKSKKPTGKKKPKAQSSASEAKTQTKPGANIPSTEWAEGEFLATCGIDQEALEKAGASWEELAAIHDAQLRARQELEPTASYIAERLRQVGQVHSVRSRIKSPRNLVHKIVRKCIENPEREITFENYQQQITDLVGLRALHLFKEEWKPIHDFICGHWDLREPPTAYVREGDNEAWLNAFKEAGCEVEQHPRKYRSIHYTAASAPGKKQVTAEIQVRTLFEEAWSEIDHRINYPTAAPFEIIGFFLEIFNRLAGSADEMGSFINALLTDLKRRDSVVGTLADERDEAMQRVEELVDELEISDTKRKRLQQALETAREKSSRAGPTMLNPSTFAAGTIPLSTDIASVTTTPFDPFEYTSDILSKQTCIRCGKEYEDDPGLLTITSECPECRNKLYFFP